MLRVILGRICPRRSNATLSQKPHGAQPPLEVPSEMVVADLSVDDEHMSTKMAWLLHTATPAPDLSEGTKACIVKKHSVSTTRTHDHGNVSM